MEPEFHIYAADEQHRALCGEVSVALCGFTREGGESGRFVASFTIPVELVPCEMCALLLRAHPEGEMAT